MNKVTTKELWQDTEKAKQKTKKKTQTKTNNPKHWWNTLHYSLQQHKKQHTLAQEIFRSRTEGQPPHPPDVACLWKCHRRYIPRI